VAESRSARTCFHEDDPDHSLIRRASAEGFGTFLLMLIAAASGLQAQKLFPATPALGLLVSAFAIAGALVGLIVAFGAVSGGHFNPLITGLQWLGRERSPSCSVAYILAQAVGAVAGALVARLLFEAPAGIGRSLATGPMALSELVGAAGLMAVVFGCSRSKRAETGPFAVGAWLTGTILATPSTAYVNPAIALGAVFAAGPIALDAKTTFLFIAVEILGALLAFAVIRFTFPPDRREV